MKCTTEVCDEPATVVGTFGPKTDRPARVTYCRSCAGSLAQDGSFAPDNPLDLAHPKEEELRRRVADIEGAPAARESFDARAAILRVQSVLADWEAEARSYERIATRHREAGHRGTADLWSEKSDSLAMQAREIRLAIEGSLA